MLKLAQITKSLPNGVPVEVKDTKGRITTELLHFSFATAQDITRLMSWRRFARGEGNPRKILSTSLVKTAVIKWRDAKDNRQVANHWGDVLAHLSSNASAEIHFLFVAKAPWSKLAKLLGFCLMHRTWSNSICLDDLGMHPLLIDNPKEPISGVGTAIFYHSLCIATAIEAATVWGETTPESVGFYRGLCEGKKIDDLLFFTAEEYIKLRQELEGKLPVHRQTEGHKNV
jgi:hypothetical protein